MIAVPERRAYVAHCMRCGLSCSAREVGVDVRQMSYKAFWSDASKAGIAGLRVASSIQRAIREDPYDAEAVTQVAEDRITIEPGRTERVDGSASFGTKVAPPCADEPCDEDLRLIPINIVIDLQQRGQAT
jgi:hypothetical protein